MIDLPGHLRFILASASPRRKQLLEQIGLSPVVIPAQIPEPPYTTGEPEKYARDLADAKCSAIASRHPGDIVLGADTIVVAGDQVLGKPETPDEARQMLHLLSNRWHRVTTAYSLICQTHERRVVNAESTRVHFRDLDAEDVENYIQTGDPFDKAGAYGIQDGSALFVDRIEGDFYTVVGFPLSRFAQDLKKLLATLPPA